MTLDNRERCTPEPARLGQPGNPERLFEEYLGCWVSHTQIHKTQNEEIPNNHP